jgi:FtsX-like permease family
MVGVRYRVGRVLRAQWAGTAWLGVVIAVVGAVVLVLVAGAVRTVSAPERYADFRGGGGDVVSVNQEAGAPRAAELEALPSVASVRMATFVFGGFREVAGDALIFTGSYEAFGGQLVEGRAADPSTPGEFDATQTFVDAAGIRLGDELNLLTVSEEQGAESGFEAFFSEEGPQGPQVTTRLVGIVDVGPSELETSDAIAIVPASLLDAGSVGISASVSLVTLEDGASEQAFRDELADLPDQSVFSVEAAEWVPDEVVRAVGTQATALGVIAVMAALVAAVVLGQLLARQVRLTDEQTLSLSGVGYTRRQIGLDALTRAAAPTILGAVLATALAVSASGIFPTGFVERVEPDPGVRFDPLVHLLGPLVIVVVLLGWVAVAQALGARESRRRRARSAADAVASTMRSPKIALGVRFAFARPAVRAGGVTTPVAGLVFAIVGLTAATIFAVSLNELVDDPTRQGYGFDVAMGQGGSELPEGFLDVLEADPDVAAVALYGSTTASVGGEPLVISGVEPVSGEIEVLGLAGRAAAADDEIVLGRVVARRLDLDIGDELEVDGDGGSVRYRVTGTAMIPSIEAGNGPGEDALVTGEGLARVDPEGTLATVGIRFRPGAPDDAAVRIAEAAGLDGLGRLDRPSVMLNLGRVRSAPAIIGVLLAGLTVLSLVVLLLVSLRARRRELAVLKALGADRRWVGRVVHWEASVFTVVLLVASVPVGVVVGRLLYRWLAHTIGVGEDAVVPSPLIAAGVMGLVVLANVVATIPRALARRRSWTQELATE